MICPKCFGVGEIFVIYKDRSVGITTMPGRPLEKIQCPECKGSGKAEG